MSVVPLRKAAVGAEPSGREPEAAAPTRAHLAQAIRSGDLSLLPGRRDEAWRWSDLRGAVRTLPTGEPAGPAGHAHGGPFAGVAIDSEITVIDGRASSKDDNLVLGDQTWRLVVASGAGAHAAELVIQVAPGASLTLLESHEGEGGGYVAALDLRIELGRGASCERVVLAAEGPDAVAVTTLDVKLSPGARFAQTEVLSGARLQRHETRLVHPGEGAEVRLDTLLLLDDRRHADATTVVEHRGRDGATGQLAKTVAAGRSRAVFQGRLVVAEGADGTDARMRHDALILGEGAEVDAKPELEIYADDVQCAHGNTIGALDEDLLFYIRSRGVPAGEARALLTQAFVGEVVERIVHPEARAAVAAWVAVRLAGIAA